MLCSSSNRRFGPEADVLVPSVWQRECSLDVNGLKLCPVFLWVINSTQSYGRKSTLLPSHSGTNNFDMSKAICIAVVLLGVCVALTLRLANGYQTADLAAAVPTGLQKRGLHWSATSPLS